VRTALIVAFGEKAHLEATACRETALRHGAEQAHILTRDYGGVNHKQSSRYAKTHLLNWTACDDIVYLDADTRVTGDLSAGFDILSDGWDMAIVPSDNQGDQLLWHIGQAEKESTFLELGYIPLQLQAGVMFIRRNERTKAFFHAWFDEYCRYGDEDQAAFLRALNRVPLKIWLLGKPWNGGPVIQHRFGAFREN